MAEGKRWHDDDRFWRVIAPVLFPRDRWQSAPEEVTKVLRLLEAREGEAVLDLACGPGRHAHELARRGVRGTAGDRPPAVRPPAPTRRLGGGSVSCFFGPAGTLNPTDHRERLPPAGLFPQLRRCNSGDTYFRAPRCGFFKRDCRSFFGLRFGLEMRNVPLPIGSDL